MTDQSEVMDDFDDLSSLWQSGGEIPVEDLVARLRQQNRNLRRLNYLSFLAGFVSVIVVLLLEFVGRIPTGGWLSLAGFAALVFSFWKYRHDKKKLIAAYSEEPAKLLPFLIQRTRAARNLGRAYYMTGFPSVGLGYLASHLTEPSVENAAPSATLWVLVAIGLLGVTAATVWGVRIARQKTRELEELEAMLAELDDDIP